MKERFKSHIEAMRRYQTSTGRDIAAGLRLDRNERVSNMSSAMLQNIWATLPDHILHVTPDIGPLYQKIAASHKIDVAKLYISAGITEGIRFLFETLTRPGQNVVVLDPTYPMYLVYGEFFQLEYRRFRYGRDHAPDIASLEAGLDANTAMVIIANPNLPIESSFTSLEAAEIADLCRRKGVVLVVDEAYHGFGGESAIDLVDDFDNLFVMRSFSKAWGLAGIRLGYAISQPQNIKYLSKTRSLVETNALTMEVAMYALDHPEMKDDSVREVKEGAALLQQELGRLGLAWHGGKYTNGILIFLDKPIDATALVDDMRERKIYIRGSFEPPYDKCVRVSLGAREQMAQFAAALEDWIAKRG